MLDYEPLDLSSVCNADFSLYEGRRQLTAGHHLLRGLPFQIGHESFPGGACLIDLKQCSQVAVPLNKAARTLVFAHALLDTHLLQNGPVGSVVAT
ncbi:MAG TPA: hypothetical protein VFT99_08055, partial [Roseiflexaceae bacterium]|nr:hypothetical protein [Roseiflexaceae bacterium]